MNDDAARTPNPPLSFAARGGHVSVMNRSIAFAALAAALAGAALAAPALAQTTAAPVVAAATAPVELTGAARSQALAAASRALDSVRALQGRFRQLSPTGTVQTGAFYLQRPGRLRFEYDAPSPLTIVSDGASLAISDRAMRTTDQLPLRATPLYFVLKSTINLEKDTRITRVAQQDKELAITARDKSGQTDGEITLVLDASTKALKRWRIIDGQGQVTQLTLVDVRPTGKIDPKLFVIDAKNDPTSRRRGG
ncbi:MAG: outer membrane lipoprotein carrier protein LolA [Alphaproteobacteria bacterium]|nr:outer membrane lipoprotein carrier protein LolA [Alphaproteobacteria bacterium]